MLDALDVRLAAEVAFAVEEGTDGDALLLRRLDEDDVGVAGRLR